MPVELELQQETTGLTHAGRVADLFFAPAKTFTDVLRNRSWWVPFLITVICSYIFTGAAASKVGFHQLTINSIRADPATQARMSSLPPEQQAANMSTAEETLKISVIATPVFILIFNVTYALLLWGSMNFLLGGKAEFATIFAMLLYADLIQDVKALLSAAVLFAGVDPLTFNMENPVGTNFGVFLDPAAAPWLKSLLTPIDLITLWYLSIITIGCAIVAKRKTGETAAVVFGWWILIVMVRVVWASVN